MIGNLKVKQRRRMKRKMHIRKKVVGSPERPRLTVFRSLKHIYAQVIDDESGRVLVAASSLDKQLREQMKGLKKAEVAQKVGEILAERCQQKNIGKVVFDRNGYAYHGRVARVASGARDKGLSF
ncbi:MAG: 50S ribosomal protein L18 [Deltaproteobacteria bacterium]|nr:MAG: 50S ribosomal protein L18 [Deltaproteobacteria bacterium]